MNNRQVPVNDRERIAVDRIVRIERNAALLRIEIAGAQKARPFRDRFTIDRGRRAQDAVRDVADENVEPADPDWARLRMSQSFNAASEARPGLSLFLEKRIDLLNQRHFASIVAFARGSQPCESNLCMNRSDWRFRAGARCRYFLPSGGR